MADIIFKDNVAEGLSRLPSQWQDSPYLIGLVRSYLQEYQEIEDALKQLNEDRSVFRGAGVQLDTIGLIVGEPRNSRADEPYRAAILNRIAINNSDGTPNNIMQVMSGLTQVEDVRLYEYDSGHYFLFLGGLVSDEFIQVLQSISPAGVSSTLLVDGGSDSFECAHSSEALQERSYLPHSEETQLTNHLARELTRVLQTFNVEAGEPSAQSGEPLAQASGI